MSKRLTFALILSASLTGLTAGTSYTVQVHAVNGSGVGAPTSATTFITLPPAPGTPTLSASTTTTATITWGAATGIVTSYAYSLNSGASWTIRLTSSTSASCAARDR